MDQEQEDRRPTDISDQPPSKKQRPNTPRLTPLINPNNIMNGLPANGYEQQQQQQQQAGRYRRRSRKGRKSRRKSSRRSRRYRR
jgi:hypothetical protein